MTKTAEIEQVFISKNSSTRENQVILLMITNGKNDTILQLQNYQYC